MVLRAGAGVRFWVDVDISYLYLYIFTFPESNSKFTPEN